MRKIAWDTMPPYYIGGKPGMDAGSALGMSAGAGVGRVLSRAVEVQNQTLDGMVVALSRQIAEADNATRRTRSWWGRFYNRGSGALPYYIKMSGHHLMQLSAMAGMDLPLEDVPGHAVALLRLDLAKAARATLLAQRTARAIRNGRPKMLKIKNVIIQFEKADRLILGEDEVCHGREGRDPFLWAAPDAS